MKPQDCIVFEDAKSGIEVAERAGIGKIIAVASTSPAEYFKDMPSVKKVICDFRNLQLQINPLLL